MMTAIAEAPQRTTTKKSAGKSPGKSPGKAADKAAAPPAWMDPAGLPQTPADLTTALAAAKEEAEKLESAWVYRGDKQYEAHQAREAAVKAAIADLTARIEVAKVRELPEAAPIAATARFELATIPLSAVLVTGNHREGDDPAGDERLARSLKAHGLQQPIGVRRKASMFELIFGSRRRRAALAAGMTEIAAKVYPEELTPLEVELLRTMENFGRKDLTAVERAIAVARCLDQVHDGLTPIARALADRIGPPGPEQIVALLALVEIVEMDPATADEGTLASLQLAKTIAAAGGIEAYVGLQLGYSRAWVKDHSYVARLGGEARKLLAAGRLSLAHARELAKLGDPQTADAVAADVAKKEDGTGGESVETTARRVTEQLKSLKSVPWRLDVAFGRGEEGCTGYACSACRFNSKSDPDLFGGALADQPDAGVCTHPTCFAVKKRITEAQITELTKEGKKLVKRGDVAATETGLGGLVADRAVHVRPAVVARQVKREIEQAAAGTAAGRSGDGGPQRTPEQIARDKLNEAERRWAEAAGKQIGPAIAKVPGATLAFDLLLDCDAWRDAIPDWNASPEQKAKLAEGVRKPAFAELMKALAKPTFDRLVALHEESSHRLDLWQLRQVVPEAVIAVAEALGVPLDPPPTLEHFLPKPKPAAGEKKPADAKPDKNPAAKKPAAKPAKGKARKTPAVDDFDAEEGDA